MLMNEVDFCLKVVVLLIILRIYRVRDVLDSFTGTCKGKEALLVRIREPIPKSNLHVFLYTLLKIFVLNLI